MLEIVFIIRGILNSWARLSTKNNENWIPTNKKYFTVYKTHLIPWTNLEYQTGTGLKIDFFFSWYGFVESFKTVFIYNCIM